MPFLKEIVGYHALLGIAFIVAFGASFAVVSNWRSIPHERLAAQRFGIVWIALATAEYWILGPASYAGFSAEMDYSLPVLLYETRWHSGGQFSHAFAGGNDLAAAFAITGQAVSLERALIAVLPLWMANMTHKVFVFAVGYVGTYLVSRRIAGCDRATACGLAALATFANEYVTVATWAHGVGFALIPLAVYLCVGRRGRRLYWAGVVLLAGINAISCSPTHSGIALLPAIAFGGLLAGWSGFVRALVPASIVFVAMLLNWAESLYAKALVAPYTLRGAALSKAIGSIFGLATEIRDTYLSQGIFLLVAIVAISLLAWRRDRRAAAMATMIAAPVLFGLAAQEVPWSAAGLSMLQGFTFRNTGLSTQHLAVIALAVALAATAHSGARWRRWVGVAVLALPFGMLAQFKAAAALNLLSAGGLASVAAVPNLVDPSWLPPGETRVLSIPYRFANQTPIAHGFHTIDGNYNLVLKSTATFWRNMVLRHRLDMSSGYLTVETKNLDLKCCSIYEFSQIVDADMLRLVNVGIVLSGVPLTGDGLRLVDGPPNGFLPPRAGEEIGRKIAAYAKMTFHPPKLWVYVLDGALPRVYSALAVHRLSAAADSTVREDAIRRLGPLRTIVVDGDVASRNLVAAETLSIDGFRLGLDAVEIEVTAPAGGVVVINIPHTVFWQVDVDGQRATLVPANMVQMAVQVPPGGRHVMLSYRRPTVSAWFGRPRP